MSGSIECGQPIRFIGYPPSASGCLVSFQGHPDRLLLLAAGHSIVPTTARQFDPIEAPDLGPLPFGRLVSWTNLDGGTTADAALVWVDPALVSPAIRGLGPPTGINRAPAIGAQLSVFAPGAGMAARKGQVLRLGMDVPLAIQGPDWQQTVGYRNQIVCTGFTDAADVGAVALDQTNQVVGIVAGSTANGDGTRATVVTPIGAILDHPSWQGLSLDIVSVKPVVAAPPVAASPPHLPAASVGDAALALDVLARTVWAEDRTAGTDGMVAVAAVILNRLRCGQRARFGGTIVEVCKKDRQFSCWNPGRDSNHLAMLAATQATPGFADATEVARAAIAGQLADPTGGARNYVSLKLYNDSMSGPSPSRLWYCRVSPADRKVIVDQIYFRNVP